MVRPFVCLSGWLAACLAAETGAALPGIMCISKLLRCLHGVYAPVLACRCRTRETLRAGE